MAKLGEEGGLTSIAAGWVPVDVPSTPSCALGLWLERSILVTARQRSLLRSGMVMLSGEALGLSMSIKAKAASSERPMAKQEGESG